MYQTEFISEDTHYYEIGIEHLFHVFSSNDGNILHGVGIFRVQPGVEAPVDPEMLLPHPDARTRWCHEL